MKNSNYTIIGLYPHNITSYNLIKESFDDNLLPSNDELNKRFIDELDSKKVLKK